jgi:preprotein translocase subunit SecE
MKSNIIDKISLILKNKKNILIIFSIFLITFFLNKYCPFFIQFKYINFFISLIFSIITILIINKYLYNIQNIFKEINYEIKNITWPSKQETLYTTFIIILISLLISIILWCLDNIIFYLISFITSIK